MGIGGTLSLVRGDTFNVSAAEHQVLPLVSLDLFGMELSIGDKVFYTSSGPCKGDCAFGQWACGVGVSSRWCPGQ